MSVAASTSRGGAARPAAVASGGGRPARAPLLPPSARPRLDGSRRALVRGSARGDRAAPRTETALRGRPGPLRAVAAGPARADRPPEDLAALAAAVLRAAPPPGERPRALVADCGGASPAALAAVARAAVGPGGCVDALVASADAATLEAVARELPAPPGSLGNSPGVRTALLEAEGEEGEEGEEAGGGAGRGASAGLFSLPTYQGPFAFAALVGGAGGGLRRAAAAASLRLKPGAGVAAGSPLDPRGLPLEALAASLPWGAVGSSGSLALRVPAGLALPGGRAPVFLAAPATRGRGRGGAALGFPTANLPVDDPSIRAALRGLPDGVYFGWAAVDAEGEREGEGGAPPAPPPLRVWPCVANVGTSPTFRDAVPERTLEVHVDRLFPAPFYGSRVRALLVGFVRPELRFASLDDLVDRIRADLGLARAQLAQAWADARNDPRLR